MAVQVEISYRIRATDSTGTVIDRSLPNPVRFACGITGGPVLQEVSLTGSAFTSLSPPSGARAVLIVVDSDASLVLKGVSGDTGVALTPSTGTIGLDVLMPVSSPSIGILNSGSTVVVPVLWL